MFDGSFKLVCVMFELFDGLNSYYMFKDIFWVMYIFFKFGILLMKEIIKVSDYSNVKILVENKVLKEKLVIE